MGGGISRERIRTIPIWGHGSGQAHSVKPGILSLRDQDDRFVPVQRIGERLRSNVLEVQEFLLEESERDRVVVDEVTVPALETGRRLGAIARMADLGPLRFSHKKKIGSRRAFV